ncbi:MAG TPA: hypothetical protein VI387_02845 [Candidatus Brocadiales bacterium]|nr:hypothetical protein [Candidatus Brocadiales bacterium]
MLIPVETWTIFSVDDERGVISHVAGAYCPLADGSGREKLPCSSGLRRCEYFHHANSKGIECIYNEVETDVIDGQTL